MTIMEKLADHAVWESFYKYKEESGNTPKSELKALKGYIESRKYLPVVENITAGGTLSVPTKKQISKMTSTKKRTVYMFPSEENYVLKLITYLLIRKYNPVFAPNLYSFRAGTGAKNAVEYLTSRHGIGEMYSYKVDISDYFNSIDIELLLPMLKEVLAQDAQLYFFFEKLLGDPRVVHNGVIVEEKKGIMAGCPTAAFLANIYLRHLDEAFMNRETIYARYSDDIIVFTPTEEEREHTEKYIKAELAKLHLNVNERKEFRTAPHEKWSFLGFAYQNGKVDISDVSVDKLKGKMRRKSMALLRWKRKKCLDNKKAAKAFVNVFNRKLYQNSVNGEITWTRWYFPTINTDESLKILDAYMQDCIRYIVTEKRTKKRFDFRYEDIKALGYRSLVNEYWKLKKEKEQSCDV